MYSCISTKKKFQRPQPPFHPRLPIQSLLLSPSHLSFPKAYRSWTILRISGAFEHLGSFLGPGGRALEVSGLGRSRQSVCSHPFPRMWSSNKALQNLCWNVTKANGRRIRIKVNVLQSLGLIVSSPLCYLRSVKPIFTQFNIIESQ